MVLALLPMARKDGNVAAMAAMVTSAVSKALVEAGYNVAAYPVNKLVQTLYAQDAEKENTGHRSRHISIPLSVLEHIKS